MTICIILLLIVALAALAALHFTYEELQYKAAKNTILLEKIQDLEQNNIICGDKNERLKNEVEYLYSKSATLQEDHIKKWRKENERLKNEVERLIKGINTRDDKIKELRKENQALINTNVNNQDQIDSLTDQLRDYKDGDFIDTSTLCNIHDDLHLNVGSVKNNAVNLLISNKDLNLTVEDLNTIHGDLDLFVVSVEDAALALLSEVEEIKAQLFYLNSLL